MMFVRELQLTYNIACNAIKCKSNRGKMRKNDRRNRESAVIERISPPMIRINRYSRGFSYLSGDHASENISFFIFLGLEIPKNWCILGIYSQNSYVFREYIPKILIFSTESSHGLHHEKHRTRAEKQILRPDIRLLEQFGNL